MMSFNYLGVVAALAAFLGIWWGHVGVRKLEATSVQLWQPILGAILFGIVFEGISIWTGNTYLSTIFGIAGMLFLWDAFEFYRQQNRVKRGHAPANPNNPRHARILAENPGATTFDWLDRHPRGIAYSSEELAEMKGNSK